MPQIDQSLILSVILLFIIAVFSAYYANQKGRSPLAWFILGVFIGVFAPLILFFLSDLKDQKTKEWPTMGTSSPDPSLHPQPPPPTDIKRREEEDKLWYYLDVNHQQMGPVSLFALRELWNTGRLELTGYVWTEGMPEWERVDKLPALKEALTTKGGG